MDVKLNVSYEQVYRSQKVCVSGPMCNGSFFHVVMCTTTSHNIGHLFLAAMNKCTELRKYAFPDHIYWTFFLFWWVLPPLKTFDLCFLTPYIITRLFCAKAGLSLQAEKPRLQFCRRQVFHRKLRNQGCSFTRNLIGAVASRCFPHPTLSVASEQTLKDLKRSQFTNEEARRVNLANWALRTSPKFATGVKH